MYPRTDVSAFLQNLLEECTANSSKDPLGAVKSARKALRHLQACQVGIPDDGIEFPSQPYIAGVTSRAKTATAEARQWSVVVCWPSRMAVDASRSCRDVHACCCSEDADPSCSAITLSSEEYASLLDAAMRYPDILL